MKLASEVMLDRLEIMRIARSLEIPESIATAIGIMDSLRHLDPDGRACRLPKATTRRYLHSSKTTAPSSVVKAQHEGAPIPRTNDGATVGLTPGSGCPATAGWSPTMSGRARCRAEWRQPADEATLSRRRLSLSQLRGCVSTSELRDSFDQTRRLRACCRVGTGPPMVGTCRWPKPVAFAHLAVILESLAGWSVLVRPWLRSNTRDRNEPYGTSA